MLSFQQELAQQLLQRYSNDLSSLVVMFPSLRARTFFNSALAELCDKPIWQPTWMSIDDMMERIAGITRGERIRLISELYKIYVKHHPNESFDKFYFWGDMLIADFDMVDKYLIDASQLLRNLEEIKELETDLSYLTPEQEHIIAFWKSLGDKESLSEQKQRFLKIWRSLPAIYNEYRARLTELGIGYSGLIYRTAAERIKRGEAEGILPNKRFIIAGFNALSSSEKILLDYLKSSEQGAEFYWDYDNYYLRNEAHEAGMFLRQNLERYPAATGTTSDNFTSQPKSLRSIACVSNAVQVKQIANILEDLPDGHLDKRTAIVLTDESLLLPLLHSLPEKVGKVNVTMGYPLKTTPAYTLVERLIALQSHSRRREDEVLFYHVDVTGLLAHTYLRECIGVSAAKHNDHIVANRITSVSASLFEDDAMLRLIFSRADDWQSLAHYLVDVITTLSASYTEIDELQSEYLRILGEEITKTKLSIERCDIEPSLDIFCSLLRRHLQTVTIPYEGEPLEGIQVMGILETRNIDFENVILLSMTDANFPGDRTKQSSFIPYNLRVAYGMPTPEEHEAMYAYYLYRLLQRSQRVDMLYCSRADEKSTGERSRYIYQLEYESPHTIAKESVGVDLNLDQRTAISVAKSPEVMELLNSYLRANSRRLSPTALFRYVECPLKFYFASVARLSAPDEVSDTIDALTFGNILHESMEELYKPLLGKRNPQSDIASLRKREIVEKAVDNTICRLLSIGKHTGVEEFTGDTLLVRDIIVKYIMRGIMRYDIEREGFTITGLEDEVNCRYPLTDGREVSLYGRADRIDQLPDGTLQIIDYKSGNRPHLEFNGLESLFHGDAHERISNIFQTLLYSMMLHRTNHCESKPSLYYASKMMHDGYSPELYDKLNDCAIEHYSDVDKAFNNELRPMLDELFNPEVAFTQTKDEDMCKYCDFKKICRR